MRVLVVDDEAAGQAEALCAALRQAGYEVTAACAAPAALRAAIDAASPDVVLLDAGTIKALADELAAAKLRLEERKLVERAKGLLMKARGLDEESAYHALRRMAMDQNRRIGEVARNLIAMAHLLG